MRPSPSRPTATPSTPAPLRVPQGCSLTLADAAMVSILLKNFEHDYAKMNEIYATYFHADKRPSRTTVGITTLARSGIVEMDMIAVRP